MIDLTYYETIAEGDKEFIHKMVQTFVEDVPDMLKLINVKLADRDYPALAKAVHKLKPAWIMSGLQEILLICIETAIKENTEHSKMEGMVADLNETAQIAIEEMNTKLGVLDAELLNSKKGKMK